MAQRLKHLPVVQETWVRSLSQDDPLEKGIATHSSILAWRIPWREEPGRLQSMESQRVRHDWATSLTHSLNSDKRSTKGTQWNSIYFILHSVDECLLSGTKLQGSQHLTCWLIVPKYWKFKQNNILTVNYGHHCTSLSNSVTLVFPFKSIPVDKLAMAVWRGKNHGSEALSLAFHCSTGKKQLPERSATLLCHIALNVSHRSPVTSI